MRCQRTDLGDGSFVITCRSGSMPQCKAVACCDPAPYQCDWKLTGKKTGQTCSMQLCDKHTTKPAEGKDLCPSHAKAWREWKEKRGE